MAVTDFTINVVSQTREKCFDEMDRVSFDVMQIIGGDPWLTIDDDVNRRLKVQHPTVDEDFLYHGTRRIMYQGPAVVEKGELPPNVTPQHVDKDAVDDDHSL